MENVKRTAAKERGKWEKSASYGDWRSNLRNWRLCQLQSHVTQKLGRISKIRPDQIYILCPSLRIHGQLPASIVSGRGDSFWKRPDLQFWIARDRDLGSGHTAYRRASLIDLYLHAKFHWNRRNFLWTDVHGWMDGRTLETGFIRSTMSKSRPNNLAIITTILSFDERAYFCVVSFGHPPHTWTVKSHLCIQYCPWLTQWTEQHISIKIQLIRSMQPKQHPSSNWSVNKKKLTACINLVLTARWSCPVDFHFLSSFRKHTVLSGQWPQN